MEIFAYDFMIRAFGIGIMSAVLTSFLGNFLVASRQAMIPAMLSHISLGGVGMGVFFHIAPYAMAIVVSLVGSSILFFLTRHKKHPPEAISMMLLSGGVAIAILFSHLAKDSSVSLETFLFGSILTTTPEEIYIFSAIFIAGMLFLFLFWNRLVGICFDKDFINSQKDSSWIIEWFFFMLLGVVVAFSLKTIGALLIGALLIVPVLAAQMLSSRFRESIWWSVLINSVGVLGGIVISFYIDVPSSSAIVLTLITLFLLVSLLKWGVKK